MIPVRAKSRAFWVLRLVVKPVRSWVIVPCHLVNTDFVEEAAFFIFRIQGLLDFFVAVLDCADPEDGGSNLCHKAIEMHKSKRRHIKKGLNFHQHSCKNYNTRTQKLLTSLNLIVTCIWN